MIEEWQALAWSKKLYELQKEKDKQAALFGEEIESVRNDLQVLEARRDEVIAPIEHEMDWLTQQLTSYHMENADKKTIKLPYATLSARTSPQDYNRDEEQLKAWVKQNAPEHLKLAVSWGDLKKDIKVVNGKAIYEPTGEIVEALEPLEQKINYSVKVVSK